MERSKLTFQHIVESVSHAIVLTDNEGMITYINSRTEKLFGYDRDELLGEHVKLLFPERYFPSLNELIQEASRDNNIFTQSIVVCRNGKTFPAEVEVNLVEAEDNMRILIMITDLTQRKEAEKRFELLVEWAPNAMILVNHRGIITLVNGEAEKLFGYSRRELIGNKMDLLIPARFRERHAIDHDQYFSEDQPRRMGHGRDLFALRKDGTEIEVEIGLNPIETPEGKVVLASIIDITERRINESIIARYIQQLERKNDELGQFAYIASHDLQEPLRTVSNYIEVFQEDYEELIDDTARHYLGTIRMAVKRMSALISDLLNYSRLGVNKELVRVDCRKLIDMVLEDLQNVIDNSKASVQVGELPELMIYETEMRQLFQNLLSNAVKFAKKEVPPEIRISCEADGDHWQFSVTDNGIGLEAIHSEKIFHIFRRLHKNNEFEGSGIGLANCKKIVELHGGKIWVKSIPEEGSVFYFTIPKDHGKKVELRAFNR